MGEDDWDGVTEVNVELRPESMTPVERKDFEQNVSKRAALYSAILLPATVGLPLSVWYCARQYVPALCRFPRSQLSYPILGIASVVWNYPAVKNMGYVMETLDVLREDIPKGALNARWGKFERLHISVDKNIAIRLQLPRDDDAKREEDTETHTFETGTADFLKQLEYGILYAISLASLVVSSLFLLLGVKRQFSPQLRIIRWVVLGTVVFVGINYLADKYTNKRNFAVFAFESRGKPLEQGSDEKDLNKFVQEVQDEQVQQHVQQAQRQVQQSQQPVQQAQKQIQQQLQQVHQVQQHAQQVRIEHGKQVEEVHFEQDGQRVLVQEFQIQQDGQQVRVQQFNIQQDGEQIRLVVKTFIPTTNVQAAELDS